MISPTSQTLERAIRAYVAEGSGLERSNVIPGNKPSPVIKDPFATVVLVTDIPDGHAWTLNDRIADRSYADATFTAGATFDVQAFVSSEITFSIQWWRAGASDYARRFAVWVRSPAGVTEAARRGFTFYRTSAIRNLSDVDKEVFEERLGLDLVIGIVWTDTRDVGLLDSVDISIFPERLSGETAPADRIETTIPTQKQLDAE